MNKWEIVRGLATDWKHHKAWWVMTFMYAGGERDGEPRVYEDGPHLVRTFDATDTLWMRAPDSAEKYFDKNICVGDGESGTFRIPHRLIWARMPVALPEKPNVQMLYKTPPWRKAQ